MEGGEPLAVDKNQDAVLDEESDPSLSGRECDDKNAFTFSFLGRLWGRSP